jgi:hypothetical protein
MFAVARRGGRSLLALGAVAALALAACSGNTATPSPTATPTPAVTPTPTAVPTASAVAGCDLSGAGAALGTLDGYQFKMTLAGGAADTALQNLNLDPADSYVLTGTIVNRPDKGDDITIASVMPGAVAPSTFHVIEVGGFDYFDAQGDGTFTQVQIGGDTTGPTDSSVPTDSALPTDNSASPSAGASQGLADQFSPGEIYQATVASSTTSGYAVVGNETKDDVPSVHCTAGSIALEQYGSTLGVTDATWTSDIWIASSGGYPVSVALVAKNKDNTLAYEVLLDLSKVNDPANKVTAPTNIGGA